jgi:formate hydrogenlyase subunit 3/multisubunit Na+/H+ antiporter MnhD subunit
LVVATSVIGATMVCSAVLYLVREYGIVNDTELQTFILEQPGFVIASAFMLTAGGFGGQLALFGKVEHEHPADEARKKKLAAASGDSSAGD